MIVKSYQNIFELVTSPGKPEVSVGPPMEIVSKSFRSNEHYFQTD